jgi:hypothetical protein
MALSTKLQKLMRIALPSAQAKEANELIAAVNAAAPVTPAADVPAVSVANATDLPSAEALANANKAAINAILVALKAAGLMS